MPKNVVCKKCNNLVNGWCEKVIDSPDQYMQRDCQYFCKEETPIELVQEWISVKDKLPEAGEYVVCIAKRNPFSMFMPMVARIKKNGWVNPITEQYISEVTHWIPLPEPPKEVICDE